MKSNYPQFAGKKVFISGGSSGIGKGLAVEFAKRGASVILSARNEKNLKTTVEELKRIGHKNAIFDFAIADVSKPEQVQKVAKKTLKILNGLDLLICNSGYAKAGKVGDLKESDFYQLMDVNFFGHVNLVRAFQDHFLNKSTEISYSSLPCLLRFPYTVTERTRRVNLRLLVLHNLCGRK